MSRHRLFDPSEMTERITEEFTDALAGLDELLAENRKALADLDKFVAA